MYATNFCHFPVWPSAPYLVHDVDHIDFALWQVYCVDLIWRPFCDTIFLPRCFHYGLIYSRQGLSGGTNPKIPNFELNKVALGFITQISKIDLSEHPQKSPELRVYSSVQIKPNIGQTSNLPNHELFSQSRTSHGRTLENTEPEHVRVHSITIRN